MAEDKKYVTLKATGVMAHPGLPENHHRYEFSHAENILKLQKKTPPRVWELADDKYEFTDGKLIERTNNSSPKKAEK